MQPGKRGMTGKHGHQRRGLRPTTDTVTLACEFCGRERAYRSCELRVRKRIRFCSKTCMGMGGRKRKALSCLHCGAGFDVSQGRTGRRFCSANCFALYRYNPHPRWPRRPARSRTKVRVHSPKGLAARMDAAKGVCVYCGRPSPVLHADHITPVSRGGDGATDNFMPACPGCNLNKGAKEFSTWLENTHGVEGLARAIYFMENLVVHPAFIRP